MAKKGPRTLVTLECSVCNRRNYITEKNKTKTKDLLTLKKYCRFCRKHNEHKEIK
ncbi:MAG: 50S ribosomal protein L33 [Candidatus Woykebacteria bacterium RBG_13_40_7b]|uniref:Large ribosomal subunit protein bL33 n=1 Tax=Candidatus Woykebacteria bacterium RBG_13_40_7b TaxID=1802594 RepID=A0A1G1WA80_9BACT|nr:MAG: 50S ribosomal protein L33 [Candidatus Woykebacteria bacterium RBG_13_40_7b]